VLSLTDTETMQCASLDPALRELVNLRLKQLRQNYDGDLEDIVSFHVVEPGDCPLKITQALGFSPLQNLVDSAKFGEPDFQPSFEWIQCHGAWFELVYIMTDDGYGTIVFVPNGPGTDFDLHSMCLEYACR
jgi:hypothetical protein